MRRSRWKLICAPLKSQDEAERLRYLVEHARQVKTHVKSLGEKAYWERLAVFSRVCGGVSAAGVVVQRSAGDTIRSCSISA